MAAKQNEIIQEIDGDGDDLSFVTPNSTLRNDQSPLAMEEFQTPLNDLLEPPALPRSPPPTVMPSQSAHTLYGHVDGARLFADAEQYSPKSLHSGMAFSKRTKSGSRSSLQMFNFGFGDRNPCDSTASSTNGEDDSEEGDDSGLDENFHTPRVAKIKSMENLSILEMEFHKASQELDRNSPRRLKQLAEKSQIPKMKSLNNLCFDNYSAQQTREEFQRIREASLEEKMRFNYQQRKNSGSFVPSKLFNKNKVGNAKFIGNDDLSPPVIPLSLPRDQYPIQKIRSMGTIPDVALHPADNNSSFSSFSTPTSVRKPPTNRLIQSAEKPTPTQKLYNIDVTDGNSSTYSINPHSSLSELYSNNRFQTHLSSKTRISRSLLKSSTPLRHSQYAGGELNSQYLLAHQEAFIVRPHSTNAAYELMRFVDSILKKSLKTNRCIENFDYHGF